MQPNVDKKVFYKTVWALVAPMAIQNLINAGVQSADVVMLGKVNQTALSAASLAGQVQFVMVLLFFGIASGASVLTAQYWGKGDKRSIEKVMAIALRFSLAIAVLFFVAAAFMPGVLMRIFSPEPDVISEGVRYLQLVAPSYLFMAFTNVYLNILRSVEKVIVSTVVYSISFVSNIIFNSIFIFGLLGAPVMGIAGAALGTTISRFIELLIVIGIAVKNPILRMRRKDYTSHHKGLFGDFMKYASPTILNELFWGVAISASAVIIGHLGQAAVAANSVAQVVRQLATVICFGIANAAAIMIGKAIGAGEPEKAHIYSKRFISLTLITSAVGGVIILLLRPFVMAAMEITPEAKEFLGFLLLVMSVYVVAQAYNTTMIVGIFRGGGDTKFGLIMDVCVMWFGSLLMSAIAAFVLHWPVEIVYILIMSDEIIKIPITTLRYKSLRWMRNVTR